MVTHGLDLVRSMCDRAAWLDHGQLVTEGRAAGVVDAYLASVNEAESRRFDEEAGDAGGTSGVAGPGRRRRSLTVTAVEFLNEAGHTVHATPARSPLTVRLRYHCDAPVTNAHFSFHLDDERGNRVAGGSVDADPRTTGTLTGSGAVDYHLVSLPVAPGTYHVSAQAHDASGGDHPDTNQEIATLVVQPSGTPIDGVVDLGGTWGPPHPDTPHG